MQSAVSASYFMTYHTILRSSKDYYDALQMARVVGDNITLSLRALLNRSDVDVFPYRYIERFFFIYLIFENLFKFGGTDVIQ